MLTDYLRDGRRRLGVAGRRFALRLRPGTGPRDAAAAVAAVGPDATVCALCYGNICRSPFAERYLRRRLADAGRTDVTVVSAGFHRKEGRRSPENAVRTAREFGVDLADHRSRRLTRSMLARSDVVLAMDGRNLYRLDREFGRSGGRPVLLGELAASTDPGAFEISDPYGGDLVTFEAVYERVAAGVDGLVDRLDDGA